MPDTPNAPNVETEAREWYESIALERWDDMTIDYQRTFVDLYTAARNTGIEAAVDTIKTIKAALEDLPDPDEDDGVTPAERAIAIGEEVCDECIDAIRALKAEG